MTKRKKGRHPVMQLHGISCLPSRLSPHPVALNEEPGHEVSERESAICRPLNAVRCSFSVNLFGRTVVRPYEKNMILNMVTNQENR